MGGAFRHRPVAIEHGIPRPDQTYVIGAGRQLARDDLSEAPVGRRAGSACTSRTPRSKVGAATTAQLVWILGRRLPDAKGEAGLSRTIDAMRADREHLILQEQD